MVGLDLFFVTDGIFSASFPPLSESFKSPEPAGTEISSFPEFFGITSNALPINVNSSSGKTTPL